MSATPRLRTGRLWIGRAMAVLLAATIAGVVLVSIKHSGLSSPAARGPVCATAAGGGGHSHTFAMPVPAGAGLRAVADGRRLTLATRSVAGGPRATVRFRVTGPDGRPVTALTSPGGRPMHVYFVRTDLGVYRHEHPTSDGNCGWQVSATLRGPATYRMFVQFRTPSTDPAAADTVLSDPLNVTGVGPPELGRTPATDVQAAGGYRVALAGYTAGAGESLLTATITKQGRPVTDLSPYLGELAHVSVFANRTLKFTHSHPVQPAVSNGGPRLTLPIQLPGPGSYTMFVQFISGGQLRTVVLPVRAG
jgi:hypothetical protein